jgi:nucleoside-diphosphate-sugar epimerase
MTIMVTGGQGFLGKTLIREILESGEKTVNFDRRFMDESLHPNHVYVQGEVGDLPTLIETVRKYNVTKIIHTAAVSHPYFSRDIPYQTVVTNALGTTNVLEAARLTGIKRVVNLSSECAYGHNSHLDLVQEEASLCPTTPYGATKVFTEHLSRVYSELYHLEVLSLRPGWIYGPGQFMQCYMKSLLRNAIDGVPTIEKSGREYRFQYVHVRDAAHACLLAANVDFKGRTGVYNITGGNQISYQNLVKYVKRLFPEAVIEIGPGTIEVLDENGPFDLSKAKEELGYVPRVTLEEGIEEYANWLQEHPY